MFRINEAIDKKFDSSRERVFPRDSTHNAFYKLFVFENGRQNAFNELNVDLIHVSELNHLWKRFQLDFAIN